MAWLVGMYAAGDDLHLIALPQSGQVLVAVSAPQPLQARSSIRFIFGFFFAIDKLLP